VSRQKAANQRVHIDSPCGEWRARCTFKKEYPMPISDDMNDQKETSQQSQVEANKNADYYRLQSIARAEEAFKYGAIEGLLYDSNDCLLSECIERDGKVYSISDAKKITFKTDCRCGFSPYNSAWGISLEKHLAKNKERREARMLAVNRGNVRTEITALSSKSDLASLYEAEKLYKQTDFKWHPYDLKEFSDKFKKLKDYDHALMWISAAIQSRMEVLKQEEDSLLASLYVAKGAIFYSMEKYQNALQDFFVAHRHYNWTPTKTLSSKITSTLKRLDFTEADFLDAVALGKREGFLKGLSYLRNYLGFKEKS
jgi:hypothetical protein